MATARRRLVSTTVTRYYHCTSRCVRGAYLCGNDSTTGEDRSHRRAWLKTRLLLVADVFCLQLAAFSIMENHFHVIVRLDPGNAARLDHKDVVQRWHRLFKGTALSQRFAEGEELGEHEMAALRQSIGLWRNQLCDLGWFMRCVKEPLARMANKEDGCKGRFWEGRYHSQALLDGRALAACMSYVDLNPLRAGMCGLPEEDQFTSLHTRISERKAERCDKVKTATAVIPFRDNPGRSNEQLPFDEEEYLLLLDKAARIDRSDKRGRLDEKALGILTRMGLVPEQWSSLSSEFTRHFHRLAGGIRSMESAAEELGLQSSWGRRASRQFFSDVLIR